MVTTTNLSSRQKQIMNFLQSHLRKKGYPPSVREIGKAVGLSSSSTVHSHLEVLERKGLIRRDPAKPRALTIMDVGAVPRSINREASPHKNQTLLKNNAITSLPLIGQVAAGAPIIAEENIESYMPMPAEIVRGDESFILTVKGDSMVEVGIFDGDYVVVRQQNGAQNGQTVVALIGDEATVKTFYKETDHVRLQPENNKMEPIKVKNPTILGVVSAVLRRLG